MKRIATIIMGQAMGITTLQAKTLVAYYNFTNNCRTIADNLCSLLTSAICNRMFTWCKW